MYICLCVQRYSRVREHFAKHYDQSTVTFRTTKQEMSISVTPNVTLEYPRQRLCP